jgi:hypothetical protein
MQTRLPVVIFDPNGDFVRPGESRPGADETGFLGDRHEVSRRILVHPTEVEPEHATVR